MLFWGADWSICCELCDFFDSYIVQDLVMEAPVPANELAAEESTSSLTS
jgi:hypothetical protein